MKLQFLPQTEQVVSIRKTSKLMSYGETTAVYCRTHEERVKTGCFQDAKFK